MTFLTLIEALHVWSLAALACLLAIQVIQVDVNQRALDNLLNEVGHCNKCQMRHAKQAVTRSIAVLMCGLSSWFLWATALVANWAHV